MKPLRVGINGLGRIGRTLVRSALARAEREDWAGHTRTGPAIEIVAANDLLPPEQLAYLLEHDSVHRWPKPRVAVDGPRLQVGPFSVRLHGERDPSAIPWAQDAVDLVFECTGAFGRRADLARHLPTAPRVILGAPGEADRMIVVGVNEAELDGPQLEVVSAASCTTHALAPVLSVLDAAFGVRWAIIGTVHSYTAGQALIDGSAKGSDWRRGRAAAANIVPTTTHATRALTQVLPHLAGKLEGSSVRVPVPDGSMWEVSCTLGGSPDLTRALDVLRDATDTEELRGVLEVRDAPLVSSDILGDPASSIVDVGACRGVGPLLKLAGWYDNEAGYSARLLDLAASWSARYPLGG